jgi:signal transduction histidine kinase
LRLNASRLKADKAERDGVQEQRGFICVLGDISTRKELERVKESHIATLTHDLKTPLLAQELVLSSLINGKAGTITSDQQKLLMGASDSVKDLLDMVNATLLFYKLESSHLAMYKQPMNLQLLLKDVIDSLQPLLEKRQLSLEFHAALNLPEVSVDPIQMKRVFHNILSNALNYALRQSTLHLYIHQADQEEAVTVCISNLGKGIGPQELPHIFDKYYSLSRKFKQIGSGLGLYIAKRIVELHGGKIWAESEPDKETRFYVSLPAIQKIAASPTMQTPPSAIRAKEGV